MKFLVPEIFPKYIFYFPSLPGFTAETVSTVARLEPREHSIPAIGHSQEENKHVTEHT